MERSASPARLLPPAGPARPALARLAVWLLHMALPLLGLWLLLARPVLDVRWEHHSGHFWLVVAVAVVNVGLGARMSEAARRRADLRVYLVALAFLSSAGFLLLHAVATPGVLVSGRNTGFVVASQAGLLLAAGFGAASAFEFSPARSAAVMRRQGLLRGGLVLLMLAWAGVSLVGLPPLDRPLSEDAAADWLVALAAVGVALYVFAAVRYLVLYRRRPAVMLLSVITAFTLLAEAMVAVALARSWRISWWEWHLLMAFGFGFVAYSAWAQYRREGGATALFSGIFLDETIRQLQGEYRAALEAFVAALRQRASDAAGAPAAPIADTLRSRFNLTEGQTEVLEQAAEAVGRERDQNQRLGALVAIGHEARVILDDGELLRRAVVLVGDALGRDSLRVGMLRDGELRYPEELGGTGAAEPAGHAESAGEALRTLQPVELPGPAGATLLLPLAVKGHAAGLLEVRRPRGAFHERDRRLLESLASQLSIAVENARLYQELDGLFRQYMSPDVATALLADPSQAALGGTVAEVTVLFADLRGFTPYSERAAPSQVVALLNRYFGAAVPQVLAEGGTVVQFVGDAIMALFNAPVPQPDHALRAARAALAMQAAVETVAGDDRDLPRFRIGVNTGPAVVGNIGSAEIRNFTAIGDTVNLAARLETSARVGHVVIGAATYELVRDVAVVTPIDRLEVKGKAEPVQAYELHRLEG
jgi:class 3 adenylate cyclase